MKNVSDIKREKNLNFILPVEEMNLTVKNPLGKIVVVIHLHYLDTLKNYFKFIEQIPKRADILVTVSDPQARETLQNSKLIERDNFWIIEKENRGRDISSFLVACREQILNYDYVCFVHDKKEKCSAHKRDTDMWIQCLWENMLGSRGYIENILSAFEDNPRLGLLVPPPPIKEKIACFLNTWFQDFELTEKLAEELGLKCDLDPEKLPLTLGTVFWAKVPALKKLLERKWSYEDFDEEPLKNDGTISHAIERIFAYVAQDADYETGWVMTNHFAGRRMEYTYHILYEAFDRMGASLGIQSISELGSYMDRSEELLNFANRYPRFYIYGAGVRSRDCFAMLKDGLKLPDGFIVTDTKRTAENLWGIPVYALEAVDLREDCGIIIAVSEKYREEICQAIEKKLPGFSNIYLFVRE